MLVQSDMPPNTRLKLAELAGEIPVEASSGSRIERYADVHTREAWPPQLKRRSLGRWQDAAEGDNFQRMKKTYTAVVERDPDTGLLVGYVPGFPGAHSQAETLDELNRNLQEVIALLLEDGEPRLEAEFVGIQTVVA